MIHIHHVVLSLQPGGLENGVVNVVNGLDPASFRSSVCCLKEGGAFAARLADQDVPVEVMGWRGGNDPKLPFKLARVFRKSRPDIVHTRNAEAFFYGFLAAKLAGVKHIVHSEHGRTFDDNPLRFTVQKLFSRYIDTTVSVSAQLKADLTRHIGIGAEHIQVLYNGVDFSHFAPSATREATRREFGFSADDLIVGSVGRLVSVKNYPLLLRAVRSAGIDRLKVLLVGDGPERGHLESLARELGLGEQVRFAGHRNDVSSLLGTMDMFVLPSISEGMSNTLLEAMAVGIACIASDVGGNREIIGHGLGGLLFESGDEATLTEHLRRLAADCDERLAIADAGRNRVLGAFSMDAMIARYESMYRALLVNVS